MNVVSMIFVSAAVAAGYWFFLYDHGDGLNSETETLRQEIVKSDKVIADKKAELQKLVKFDDSVKVLGETVQNYLDYIPSDLNSRILFEDLTQIAGKSAVHIRNINNSPAKEENELYESLTISMVLEARFSDFLTFLSELTSLNKIIVVGNVSLRALSSGQKPQSSKITANVNLTGFRYVDSSAPQDEKEKNKEPT